MANTTTIRIDAEAVADDSGVVAGAGGCAWLLVEAEEAHRLRVEPPGRPAFNVRGARRLRVLDRGPGPGRPEAAERIECSGRVLVPGLVNAHTHLDLTLLGPRPFDEGAGFAGWVEMIRRERPADPGSIAAAVRAGAALAMAGGVVAVGDIAGCPPEGPTAAAYDALRKTPLSGVSFLEFFGIMAASDRGWAAAEAALAAPSAEGGSSGAAVRLGLQPHAPNTVSLTNYDRAAGYAARHALPLATHLAETQAERAFIEGAEGPQRALLERLGLWIGHPDHPERRLVGRGRHPIEHLAPVLSRAAGSGHSGWLVAHVNDCPEPQLGVLARTGASVAYCPRSAAYFGNARALGPHRWHEMLRVGTNVCLGTDSVVNLAADRGSGAESMWPVLSPWEDLAALAARCAMRPVQLLAMVTTRGARALGLPEEDFRLRPGVYPRGVVAAPIDALRGNDRPSWDVRSDDGPDAPLARAIGAGEVPKLLLVRNESGLTGSFWGDAA